MNLYCAVCIKIIPLYISILIGFIAGKWLKTPRDVVANLIFFMFAPVIMFNGVFQTRIDSSILFVPIFVFCYCSLLCFFFYRISKNMWHDSTKNLLAYSAGTGNTGFFGLPLAILLFDNQGEGVYMMSILGIALYENSIGFYTFAKGTHNIQECLQKILRMPMIYAFFAGLLANFLQLSLPSPILDFMCQLKGTFTILGMMIIGLGLASITHFKIDYKYIGMAFLAKFLVWPGLMIALITADTYFWDLFSQDVHNALILLSLVPIAVSTVIFASILHSQPEKAATAVLASTLFALFYVPFMIILFIPNVGENIPLFHCTY